MKIFKLENVIGSKREVDGGNWVSRRLILADEGYPLSLHDTIIKPDTETLIWYKHHHEIVYCIEGQGEVEVVPDGQEKGSGKVYPISAGTVYDLNGNERHYLRANKGVRMRMVCMFMPALLGNEVHDKDGVYSPAPAINSDTLPETSTSTQTTTNE